MLKKVIKDLLSQKQSFVKSNHHQTKIITFILNSRAIMRESHQYNINHPSWKKIFGDFVLSRYSSSRASLLPMAVVLHPNWMYPLTKEHIKSSLTHSIRSHGATNKSSPVRIINDKLSDVLGPQPDRSFTVLWFCREDKPLARSDPSVSLILFSSVQRFVINHFVTAAGRWLPCPKGLITEL